MSDTRPGEFRHWHLATDDRRTGWLTLDRADAGANTLSTEVMEELDRRLATLPGDLKGLVICSAKERSFIAGADVNEFPKLDTAARAYELVRRGQGVLERLATLPFPTCAALNGHALGGGLELALACDWRLAARGDEAVFGLPEVQLGVHPGFGGTVRLVRLLGVRQAMDLMLTGRPLRPGEARRRGLVDDLAETMSPGDGPDAPWRAQARALLARGKRRPSPPLLDRLLALPLVRPLLARQLHRKVETKAPRNHYPAPHAVVDLWERHGAAEGSAAYEAEARSFADLVVTPTSRNLVRVFFLQDRLKKSAGKAEPVGRVHVIGAGVMGGDIAAWCALRGLEVTLQDRELKYVEPALLRADRLFEKKLRNPGALAAARARLVADVAGEGARQADVVIEAVFEDLAVKRQVYGVLEPLLKPGAILATNTSSIPLEQLADCLQQPARLIGLHFFNPVAKLPLVEVVQAAGSDPDAVTRGAAFARQIGKLPLPCRSHPGFLVNRILAPYLAEAMELLREGVPLAVIDQAALDFGMPMGPIELADSVGLDVALHVARILAPVIGRSVAPELEQLVSQKHLGVKTGQGFYTYRDRKPVRPAAAPAPADGTAAGVQERLVMALLNEAAHCLAEGIVADADLVDAGVIFGTGFAPFRGGPLHHARTVGLDTVRATLGRLQARHGERFRPSPGWDLLESPRN